MSEATEIAEQEKFQHWLKNQRNLKSSSIQRTLKVGKAALNWSWKRRRLDSVPYILPIKVGTTNPKGRPLSFAEVELLLNTAHSQHLKDFIWLMIGTASRSDAILDLTFDQCDIPNRLISLNAPGREQTNKYRPTVRMPENLVPLIKKRKQNAQCDHILSFRGRPLKSVRSAWRLTRKKTGLDAQVNPYSIRHTMARWMRSQSVPAWEVSSQLGHKQPDMSTTEIYAPFDPAHLARASAAIDEFMASLRVNCV